MKVLMIFALTNIVNKKITSLRINNMGNKARVRVEAKWIGESSSERQKAFKYLLTEFQRRVSDAGIKHIWKEHEYYESAASKRRKKDRESLLRRKREQLEERINAGERVAVPSGMFKKKKSKNNYNEDR